MCIIGVGVVIKISYVERKLLKFHTDSHYVMMFVIYTFHKILFFYERKNAIILIFLFFMKKWVDKYTMARFTSINHPIFSCKLMLL